MERLVGTVSRGIRAPIIRQGDDIAQIVVDSVLAAAESDGFSLRENDVIAVKVLEIDSQGKIKLSRKDAVEAIKNSKRSQ